MKLTVDQLQAFKTLGIGMSGIFLVMAVLYAIVKILGKIFTNNDIKNQ